MSAAPSAAPAPGPAQAAPPERLEDFLGGSSADPRAGLSAQERANMDAQRAHPAGELPSYAGLKPGEHPGAIRNALAAGFNALEPLGEWGVQALGKANLISPEREQQALNNPLVNPEQGRVSARVGGALAPLAFGLAAPEVMAIQGAENARRQNEAAIAAGQNPSLTRQAINTVGQTTLGETVGRLLPGQKAGNFLFGRLPFAARALAAPAVSAAEAGTAQRAGNLVAKGTVNPNQDVNEGVGEVESLASFMGPAAETIHTVTGGAAKEMAEQREAPIRRLLQKGRAAAQPEPDQGAAPGTAHAQEQDVHAQDNRPNPRESYANLVGQLGDEADRWKQQAETQRQRQRDAVAVAGQPAPAAAEAPVQAERQSGVPAAEAAEPARPGKVPAGPEGTAAVPERAAGEHPTRISGGQDLADYVNRISGDNADIIGHMTANQGFVKALVPIDQLHNLGGTQEDVVAAKAKEPQKNPAVTLPSGAGGEGHLDVWDGNHAVEAARQRGDTHAEAYVPESMVGKNGIEEVRAADQTAHTSQQVQTERPQMFGARKGTVAVPDALNKLVQRDVAPAVSRTASNAKASLDAVNRFAGTGLNLSETSRDTAISLRENEAGHEVNQARMETELKPYRDELEKLTPDQRAQWVDDAEQHGMSGHPKLWGLELLNRKWNKANAEEGKQYGLDTSKWKADWIGRLAVFPQGQESGPGGKTRGSIAGSQKFRLARDYDTFSEFKKAVEDAGGKLKYENPADMLLAKQMEVRRSIEARKQMYQQEKAGQLTWRPDSEKSADEPHDTKLDDPLARQTRDVVAPKWMVAKLLNMPHAEAEQYLKSKPWQNKSQTLRPGDEMPQGYAKSGEQVAGTYHADANTAGLFNNLISKGFEKSVPVLSQIANLRRRVTALNLAVPTAHAALTTVSNSVNQLGLAMEAAAKGHWDLAVKNAYRAVNPAAAANFGAELRQQAANPKAHPELEQTVQTSMKGGNKFDLKSVLNETAYQKAKTEWEAGNTAGAAGRGLKAVYHAIEAPLFERYIPNIKAAAKGAAAEIAVRDDLSGKELSRKMALAQDNVDNLLGMVKRSHQFQNRILTDLQDVVFTAPKFAEGTFRFAGAVGRDTAAAVRDLASGKKPAMTPAMYSAAAGILTHMAGSALMQLAYTTATTGKAIWPTSLEDYYKPRTGRKDDAGRDERVSILSPFSALFSAGEHGVGSVTGRVAGLWKAAKAEMTGVDEQGRKLEGVKGRLEYAGKQALPYSVQNLMDLKKRGAVTPDKVAGSMLGMHFSHEGSTPAERAAWGVIHAHYQAQPRDQEEADKSDTMQKLVHEQHTHDPKTGQDIQKALQDGVISNKDVSAIRRRATEKPGLAGLLHSSEIDAKSLMSDVWPKMTPDERKQFRLIVRGKIGRSSLPYAQKQELWKQTDP